MTEPKRKHIHLSAEDTVLFVEEFLRAHATGDTNRDAMQKKRFKSLMANLDMTLVEKLVEFVDADIKAGKNKADRTLQRYSAAMLWAVAHMIHDGTPTIRAGCAISTDLGDFLHMATHMVDYGAEINGHGKLHNDLAEAGMPTEEDDAMMEKHFRHPDGKLN